MLLNVLCFHYFPLCSPECPDIGVTPCRQLCTEAVESCLPYARVLYRDIFKDINDFPHILNCSNFADANSETTHCSSTVSSSFNSNAPCCFASTGVALECPNATIYIDFSPPIGSRVYQVLESAGSVEICLVLASVGYTSTLSVPVTLKLLTKETKNSFLPTAAQNDDYAEPVGLLKTPAGSIRGAKYCIEVGVIEDYLKEGRESFSVEATLLSPPSARIGSNGAQSSTASVEVIIIDNDEPYIPEDECRSKCSIRSRANSNTFTQNSYTYAVHVEALEQRDSNYSSLLDVIILECWELESNVCPEENHAKYSIPVCRNCILDFSGGKEYLIAGRHVQGAPAAGMGLYLPNYRKGGLFATWKTGYSSINEWILAANEID